MLVFETCLVIENTIESNQSTVSRGIVLAQATTVPEPRNLVIKLQPWDPSVRHSPSVRGHVQGQVVSPDVGLDGQLATSGKQRGWRVGE